MDTGTDPLTGQSTSSAVAKVLRWKVALVTNDTDMLSIWSENWEKSKGKAKAKIYSLRFPREIADGRLPPDGSAYFEPVSMKYLVVNPSSYDAIKAVAVRVVTNELAERDGKYISINGSCAEVLGKGVCLMAPKGLGKTTHVYGLAGWTRDSSTRFHSDGWFFASPDKKEAISPERWYYLHRLPSLSLSLRRLFSRSRDERGGGYSLSKDLMVMDGFLADPTEFMGRGKSTKKCKLEILVILKRDESDQSLIKPLTSNEALSLLESGVVPGDGVSGPYFNQLVVRDKDRDERRKKMYERFLKGLKIYLVNAREQPWITQTLIRGLALGEWSWAKLVDGQVYALRGEKYEPLFKSSAEGVESLGSPNKKRAKVVRD